MKIGNLRLNFIFILVVRHIVCAQNDPSLFLVRKSEIILLELVFYCYLRNKVIFSNPSFSSYHFRMTEKFEFSDFIWGKEIGEGSYGTVVKVRCILSG